MHKPTSSSSSSTAVPSRPAPAPPPGASGNPNRYTPTTNWEDSPFNASLETSRKVPPPRPPPPRVQPSPVQGNGQGKVLGLPFKKSTPQSVNILTNLFGSRGSANSGPKLPPPPPVLKKHQAPTKGQVTRTTSVPLQSSSSAAELIDWSSPPSSPTLTHKTFNSDCISVDSFSSETHSNTSPQNGSYYSQAESGFEDDFSVQQQQQQQHQHQPQSQPTAYQDLRQSVANQITLMDPFSAPPLRNEGGAKIRQVPPPIAQKPKIVEQSAFYTQNSISFQPAKPFDDPLSNGKCLIAAPTHSTASMPTIIKPLIMAKPLGVPQKDLLRSKVHFVKVVKREDSDKTPSPPMPIYAPPPPPPEYFAMAGESMDEEEREEEQHQESYGIALYDYESAVDGDLNFRANDKIYLVREENDEWMFGRCRRGCEGLFPANYIEIKVPIAKGKRETRLGPIKAATVPEEEEEEKKKIVEQQRSCRALYDFNAEAEEDLSIREGETITIVGVVNAEWLLGRKKNGTQGQFPAAFVEYL